MIIVLSMNVLLILWVAFLAISGAPFALLIAHIIGGVLGNVFGYLIFEA